MSKQSQEVDSNSTAYQAGGSITVHQGLTYGEAKTVALDVFNANFFKLAEVAKDVAETRAREITERILQRLQDSNPDGLEQARDPGFQYSLFSVQKEYACTGDEALGDLLVDLLVERSREERRSFIQIVLDESIKTAPKLTDGQLAALTTIFLLRYTKNVGISNLDDLVAHLDKVIRPLAGAWAKSAPSFQHLQFAGCGAIEMMPHDLVEHLKANYGGIFMRGFSPEEIAAKGIDLQQNHPVFVRCLNGGDLGQLAAINYGALDELFNKTGIDEATGEKLREVYREQLLASDKVRDLIVSRCDYMGELFDLWSPEPMGGFSLTSVGMAIGHANLRRIANGFTDLSVWIH